MCLYKVKGDFDFIDLEAEIVPVESLQSDQGRGAVTAHALASVYAGGGKGAGRGTAGGRVRGGELFERSRNSDRGRDQHQQQMYGLTMVEQCRV